MNKVNKSNIASKAITAAFMVFISNLMIFSLNAKSYSSEQTDSATIHFEGKGASSPEQAVSLYFDALKSTDYKQILSCYAVESFAKNYHMEKSVERYGAVTPTMMFISAEDDFLKQLSIYEVISQISKTIKYQVWNLGNAGLLKNGHVINADGDIKGAVDRAFPDDIDKNLKTITFQNEFFSAEKLFELYFDGEDSLYKENLQKSHNKTKAVYGADEIKDVTAKFSIGGREFYYIAETVRYGRKWYISPNQGYTASCLGLSTAYGCMISAYEIKYY